MRRTWFKSSTSTDEADTNNLGGCGMVALAARRILQLPSRRLRSQMTTGMTVCRISVRASVQFEAWYNVQLRSEKILLRNA